jgi:hypothetical protein
MVLSGKALNDMHSSERVSLEEARKIQRSAIGANYAILWRPNENLPEEQQYAEIWIVQ